MKAMILAAGLGTRLKPFTDNHPKALALVNGKTLIQRNIEYLIKYGICEIIINLHHFAGQIVDFLEKNNNFNCKIAFSNESNKLLETGGGLKKASWFFQNPEPFILMNVDILTDMNINHMLEFHLHNKAIVTLAVSTRSTARYFLFDKDSRLCGWRNVSTGHQQIVRENEIFFEKAFSGIHIISPKIFPYLHSNPEAEDPEKFSIVDSYLEITKSENIICFDHSGYKLIDVGKPESINLAEKLFS